MNSVKRTAAILVSGLLLLFVLVVALGQSDPFLRWLSQRSIVTQFVTLDPAHLKGDLFGPIEIDQATVQASGWRVDLKGFHLVWQPAKLLNGKWVVDQLTAQYVNVAATDSNTPTTETPWGGFSSPIDIELHQVHVAELTMAPLGEPDGRLENIAMTIALAGDRVTLQHLAAEHKRGVANATGTATLSTNLPINLEIDWRLNELPMEVAGHATVDGDLRELAVAVTTHGDVVARSDFSFALAAEPLTANGNLLVDRVGENSFEDLAFDATGWFSAAGQLGAELDWRGLTWPIAAADWQSPRGHLEVSGLVDNLNLIGNADAVVQLPNEADTRWQIDYRAQVAPDLIRVDEVTIQGEGRATFSGSHSLSAGTTKFDCRN